MIIAAYKLCMIAGSSIRKESRPMSFDFITENGYCNTMNYIEKIQGNRDGPSCMYNAITCILILHIVTFPMNKYIVIR